MMFSFLSYKNFVSIRGMKKRSAGEKRRWIVKQCSLLIKNALLGSYAAKWNDVAYVTRRERRFRLLEGNQKGEAA